MKIHLLIFTIGLMLGLLLSFLCYNTVVVESAPKTNVQVVKNLEKDVTKSEVKYAKVVDSLKSQSVKLQVQLMDTKSELTKAKQKNSSLQVTIYDLLDKRLVSKEPDNFSNDTSYDSLIVTVEELMQTATVKDSLFEKVTSNLEDQLKNKDSTIASKENQYQEIKTAFTKCIEGQKEFIDQNKLLHKEAKRQKFKCKALSAVLLIFTGAATNYLIHH